MKSLRRGSSFLKKKKSPKIQTCSIPLLEPVSILRVSSTMDSLNTTGFSPSSKETGVKKSVRFEYISIRYYERVPGDNPCVRTGVPMSIGWHYNERPMILIEEYEKNRKPRRGKKGLILSVEERESLLRYEWNFSRKEIASAVREAARIKNLRRRTIIRCEYDDQLNFKRLRRVSFPFSRN